MRRIRIVVSLLFLIPTTFIFIDYNNFLTPVKDWILYLQFTPSLINFIGSAGLIAAGFIVIIFFTTLFGRVYCSSVCPLGTLQDLISRLPNRKRKKKRYSFTKPLNLLRNSILAATIVSFFAGSLIMINLLDPFSNYGRVISDLVRPVYFSLINLFAGLSESFGLYFIYPVEINFSSFIYYLFPIVFLITISVMAYFKGRLFCNSICPVGSLLSLISRYSVFKLKIDEDNCKGCGICERVCKSNCIDNDKKEIDFTRCVNCYNCVDVCPSGGIKYFSTFNRSKSDYTGDDQIDSKKRSFIAQSLIYVSGLAGLSYSQIKIIVTKESTKPAFSSSAVTPPGSKSTEYFTDNCTACHLCVSACPTQVLQPSFLEYGILGILQPRMDFYKSFCNFECKICGDVCPTGAIKIFPLEHKKLIQTGIAKFVKENCIVLTQKTECGACSEHCPTKAVHMIPDQKLFLPEVREEYCIGCGACEYACPTKPYKAIFVEGNLIHKKAKLNETEKVQPLINVEEDFPF